MQGKRKNIYFISGLGADRRAFSKLRLPAEWTLHYLDWIEPEKDESLDQYAKRLSTNIDKTQPFILVGLSFGGMIASAMSSMISTEKIILISSISSAAGLPWYFRLAGRLGLHKLLPTALIKKPNCLVYWIFGARNQTDKRLLRAIISETAPAFIRWSLNAIMKWKKKPRPPGVIHIHGTNDKILPIRFANPDILINNGSHFMVWTRAAEVSRALVQAVQNQMNGKTYQAKE